MSVILLATCVDKRWSAASCSSSVFPGLSGASSRPSAARSESLRGRRAVPPPAACGSHYRREERSSENRTQAVNSRVTPPSAYIQWWRGADTFFKACIIFCSLLFPSIRKGKCSSAAVCAAGRVHGSAGQIAGHTSPQPPSYRLHF